jgi:HPt (histidine-containing phosphotransfer) domain-containing protein
VGGDGLDDVHARTQAAIRAVWHANRPVYLARLAALEVAAEALKGGALDPAARMAAIDEAHKIAGAVGTFGFPAASAIAKQIEAMLRAESLLSAADGERMAGLAAAMREHLDPR